MSKNCKKKGEKTRKQMVGFDMAESDDEFRSVFPFLSVVENVTSYATAEKTYEEQRLYAVVALFVVYENITGFTYQIVV